ncbi:vacuolar protein sorting-associated protein 73 [Aulographum hederae CBS 113979]|uniref:Vacuolar protein sorting-associated protein 73 n=1 Tax=Aulographum hederae CBS 113979 TaxID=1176131 RepID=A0A6G1GQA8_9PEZI|nr:vacuolar protein sorting-associated protein 73 [Aulographum hederae CBS 113979]
MDPRTWVKDLTPYFIFVLIVSTIGPFLFGFHLAELNTPQDVITCKKQSIHTTQSSLPQCIPMNPTEIGAVSSVFTLGGLAGALAAGPLSSRYGRLKAMFAIALPAIVGPAFEALSPNIAVMSIGRFLSGIGAGASTVVVPLYISEVSPPKEKGLFGAFTQIMINMGIFIAQLLGFFLSHGQYWRIILAAGGMFGLAQTFGLLFTPESPKWSADQGRLSLARKILRKLRGHKFDIEDEVKSWGVESSEPVDEEEETLLQNENSQPSPSPGSGAQKEINSSNVGMIQVITDPQYNRATLAVIVIMLAQQLTGINSIVMYGVSLLSKLLSSNSATLNLGVSALNVFITALCAPLADSLGRKPCLLASIFGMGTSSILLAIGILKSISIMSAVAVLTFVASFGVGLGPVPFILSSELVGNEAVGAVQSWALAANWIATFLVAQFFPILNEAIGQGKIYFLFAALAAVFFTFTVWWIPETRGKTSLDEVWGREPGSSRVGRNERED